MKTSAGEVEIAVPRDRNGEFEPRLVKKNETTLSGDIEEKIISMYAKWTDLFENTTMVAALIDRLTFRSHVLDMNGDSYRLRSALQGKP